ncbi:TetR family transcriptional regulator [Actinokineospora enzanensis]|uniref:acyl-CoA-like ligand-binding transcription factor n=1 Tax=Actinokineospora enzanensis TaxID=155975 RepID=UPI00036FB02C|nr:TetR family transcriptional regulator [Actinokineospora enzanensis]
MTEDEGLRERKKRETRVALSRAAIRLCVQRGWANVTIEDIAGEADVSVRTFRNYFGSKAEAIAASHIERMRCIAEDLREQDRDAPLWEAIVDSVVRQFAAGTERPKDQRWTEAVRLVLSEPALHGEVVKAGAVAQTELAEAVAERTGTDVGTDLYPKLVAAIVLAISGQAVDHCLGAEPPVPLGPTLRDAFAQLVAGLPEPGRRR